MKVLVIGYGSMGRRRIRLTKELCSNVSIICVDSNPLRMEQAKQDGYTVYTNIDGALEEKPDCAFVCTSPGRHSEIILRLIAASVNTFTELNLVDTDYDKIISLSKEKKVKVFMSSTMLYDRQIKTIKKIVDGCNCRMCYMYHVGQYLPDWHPWESYKDFFISDKETNGCREILAIQLPWIIDVFGEIEECHSMCVKNSDLDIDYDDTYYLQIRHKNGTIGSFVCDVVSRKAVNSLEIIGEKIHLNWDGTPEGMFLYDFENKRQQKITTYTEVSHVNGYADNIIEDEYMDEIKAFFDYIDNDEMPAYDFEKDEYVLSLINKVEGKY